MKELQEFERYLAHLGEGLGHAASATTKTSSRNWGSGTTKAEAGAGSITTPA